MEDELMILAGGLLRIGGHLINGYHPHWTLKVRRWMLDVNYY
jgi:hypothetical protein